MYSDWAASGRWLVYYSFLTGTQFLNLWGLFP